MNISSISVFFIMILSSFNVNSENVMNSVMLQLFEHKFPVDIYNQKNITWEHGTYSINVKKNGQSTIRTTDKIINAKMPIKVKLQAHINKDLGIAKINLNCLAEFNTNGDLSIIPDKENKYMKTDAIVNIVVPNVDMNCDGIKVPITAHLRTLVSQNKIKWEQTIKHKYNTMWKG